MILNNNRAPLLCCFKLCASLNSHQWIQTGVTVRKRPIWVKIGDFSAVWPSYLTDDPEKQYGTSLKQHQAFCITSSSYANLNLSYRPETAQLDFDLCDLDLWPLTLTFCMESLLSLVITPENVTMIPWQEHCAKRCKRRTDGLTDRRTDGQRKMCSWSYMVAATNKYYRMALILQHNHSTLDSNTQKVHMGNPFRVTDIWNRLYFSPHLQ